MEDSSFRELLEKAFVAARESGKRDWHLMTIAVLKNRLLQMTNRTFDERAFGADSFMQLVARHSDLVAIDRSTKPPTVVWSEATEGSVVPATETPPTASARIRNDLWRAVLDYSSGREYEWDVATGQARPVEQADPNRRLPTIDGEDLARMRQQFLEKHRDDLVVDATMLERVTGWAEKGLGTRYLPGHLQGVWNSELQQAVAGLLSKWFQVAPFNGPELILQAPKKPPIAQSAALRELVHRCVDLMSVEELRALPLPAHLLLRLARPE